MAIDRGDSHFEKAGDWQRACRHIGLFLWWAAERGLTADDVDRQAVAKAPTDYLIHHCDAKLWEEDLNDEGAAFASTCYTDYLTAVSVHAKLRAVGEYEIPDDEQTHAWFFEWLDQRLEEWRRFKARVN